MKPVLVSSGEPAGIGPDICLSLADAGQDLVVLGDRTVFQQRCQQLGRTVTLVDYKPGMKASPGHLLLQHVPCQAPVVSGQLDVRNANYVMNLLEQGIDACLSGEFSALVTAPVHKAIINQAGIAFTGHTEFLAQRCGANQVVMMLACKTMKVALVTTHLPLHAVPAAITKELIIRVIKQVHQTLQTDFALSSPCLYVAGLNPHAGEGGYLGDEEINHIQPALDELRAQGLDVHGPFPADTMFAAHHTKPVDAYITMYHDQGLPVLKYAGFGEAVNVTLGLPIIRTSVDHGTALDLAGSGRAETGSLREAVAMAQWMAEKRLSHL